MPIKRPQLANNEIYHIVVRGIERINIFKEKRDYYRFIRNLFEFNDSKPAGWDYRFARVFCVSDIPENSSLSYPENCSRGKAQRKPIVAVLAFCLMPNHAHLLIQQIENNGISAFMRKLGAGYVGYFNKKYKRQGHLFQGRFRAVHIKNDNQLKSVFVYIHTNPAALIDSNWKEGGIKKVKEVIEFIENYRWSSYMDYLGKNNFLFAINCDFFNQIMDKQEWRKFVNEWVEYKNLNGWDINVELE